MIICLNCFNESDETQGACPFCGVTDVHAAVPTHLVPGVTLHNDRYLIGMAVSSGKFDVIYKAYDTQTKAVIAIKEFFPEELATRPEGSKDLIVTDNQEKFNRGKSRFLAEAKAMSKFRAHGSILNVFDFFEESNTAYIVMELLEGTALDDFLKLADGPIDKDLAIYITNEIGRALMSLHKEGIIHREVTPENIFLCNDDMVVKLLDFGSAKLTDDDSDVIDVALKSGFAPLEQYKKKETVDATTDVYSLGATLYVMLTNARPDEAISREFRDNLVPPNKIIREMNENLSNAIMKAMAIDRHQRFATISEFLKAINGEKKVVTLKEEKNKSKIKLIGIIAAAVLVVSICSIVAIKLFSKDTLEPVTLTVWYKAESGSDKIRAMEYIKKNFEANSKHKGVVLELKAIDPATYNDEIEKAASEGKLPNVFESTDCDDSVLGKCVNLKDVAESEQAEECLFLDDYYDVMYKDGKQIPLAFETPVAIVTDDYDGNTFTSSADFGDSTIAWDRDHAYLIAANLEPGSFYEEDTFPDDCPVLITSSSEIDDIQDTLATSGKAVYLQSENVICRFTYEWSISKSGDNEIKASESLLSYMLSNDCQGRLVSSISGNGELPLCEETLNKLCKSNDDLYGGLKEIKDDLTFEEISISSLPEPLEKDSWAEFDDDPNKNIENFIRNAYKFLLNREVDQEGFDNWYKQLTERTITPEDFIRSMIGTGEFTDRNLSNEDYIAAMYKTILYRVPDEEGQNAFVEIINNGSATRESVLDIFFGSDEWTAIKTKMGI